jgi:hypothetical protein
MIGSRSIAESDFVVAERVHAYQVGQLGKTMNVDRRVILRLKEEMGRGNLINNGASPARNNLWMNESCHPVISILMRTKRAVWEKWDVTGKRYWNSCIN